MFPIKGVIKRYINLQEEPIDPEKFFKNIRKKSEDMGYLFFEREHVSAVKKYGEQLEFKFFIEKEIDQFAKVEISVAVVFEKLEKVKNKYIGEGTLTYAVDLIYDYKNRWGKNKFDKFLFSLYMKIMKWTFENKYLIPYAIMEGNEIYDSIKADLETY